MALKIEIEYLIHVSKDVPKFVTVYRPMLPGELWYTRKHKEYGKLQLVEELCFGSEDDKKFSEGLVFIVSNYTEARAKSRKLANDLGLIKVVDSTLRAQYDLYP